VHIPDGYLGPQTYVATYAVMAPVWAWAARRVRRTVSARRVPLVALGAAFSFVVMLFNIPVPGGTTGHAVGSVLVALLLGPAAAILAVSLTLAVQAVLFADGGITAYAANCLAMAVVAPVTGVAAFEILAGWARSSARRRRLAAGVAGWVGINAAALVVAVLLGLQPHLARDAAGQPVYCPFGLRLTIPAMAVSHLLAFGIVEAVVTGFVFGYVARTDPGLVAVSSNAGDGTAKATLRRLAAGIGALVLLSPLGLILPATLGAGSAWGEWSAKEIEKLVGFVPHGLARLGEVWRAPLPGYGPAAGAPTWVLAWVYPLAAALGVAVILLVVVVARRWLIRPERDRDAS
jgi:cobalt/nickel transport system permease protein